jgi:hypothetical protein
MTWIVLLGCLLAVSMAMAQRGRGRGGWGEGYIPNADSVKTAREVESHSTGTPNWTNAPGFEKDAFTFARVRYASTSARRFSGWITDFPDSDLNLSYRLQQMTSLKVDPNGRVLNLTDPDLFTFPWIYMVEPGALAFEDEEVIILRNYLLNGGFLMADDFWGEFQWENFARQLKRVFPERSFQELSLDHPVFHGIFELKGPKNKLQVPNVRTGIWSEQTGVTWENHDGEECIDVHIRAIFDDRGHIMVLACHNTDNGDGWEREGENDYYFHRFSENIAFPLAINIVFYSMSH